MSAPDWPAVKEALAQVEYGVEHHGGVFNEDLRVLDGVDPQAWSLIEDFIEPVLEAARQWLVHGPALKAVEEVWWCEVHREESSEGYCRQMGMVHEHCGWRPLLPNREEGK